MRSETFKNEGTIEDVDLSLTKSSMGRGLEAGVTKTTAKIHICRTKEIKRKKKKRGIDSWGSRQGACFLLLYKYKAHCVKKRRERARDMILKDAGLSNVHPASVLLASKNTRWLTRLCQQANGINQSEKIVSNPLRYSADNQGMTSSWHARYTRS